jgi:spore maturation protein SpmA
LHEAGLMRRIAAMLRPLMVWLFPSIPKDHPALGMMVLNMASNMLGLGNAATPFGLRAMRELERLNTRPGVATDAMVLFLTINTSGLAVLPTGMIALRASLGSQAPSSIFLPTVLSTLTAAVVGILAARILARLMPVSAVTAPIAPPMVLTDEAPMDLVDESQPLSPMTRQAKWGARAAWCVFIGSLATGLYRMATNGGGDPALGMGFGPALHEALNTWPLLVLMLAFVLLGLGRGVSVYDAVVTGAKEGFTVALRIIPYLVTMMVAVGMLRASGAIAMFSEHAAPLTEWFGMPAEALPMALLRPLTGTGAYAVAADIMRAQGPDSLAGEIVSTIMGTTETTFYVLALYLGAVGIKYARHAVLTCVISDIAGTMMAVWSCRLMLH